MYSSWKHHMKLSEVLFHIFNRIRPALSLRMFFLSRFTTGLYLVQLSAGEVWTQVTIIIIIMYWLYFALSKSEPIIHSLQSDTGGEL